MAAFITIHNVTGMILVTEISNSRLNPNWLLHGQAAEPEIKLKCFCAVYICLKYTSDVN